MEVKPFTSVEFSEMLSNALVGGFDVEKISRFAFDVYRLHGRQLTPMMDRTLLMLMAMSEGPEFELDEREYRDIIRGFRAM